MSPYVQYILCVQEFVSMAQLEYSFILSNTDTECTMDCFQVVM